MCADRPWRRTGPVEDALGVVPIRLGQLSLVLLLAATGGCLHVEPRPLSAEEGARAFEARSLSESGLRGFLELGLAEPLSEWPLRRWDLKQLTLAAVYFRPSLAVARAQAEVASAGDADGRRAPESHALGRPGVDRSNPDNGVSPWLAALQLDWPIETAGKRGHRIERAAAAAQSREVIDRGLAHPPAAAVGGRRARRREAPARLAAARGRDARASRALLEDRVDAARRRPPSWPPFGYAVRAGADLAAVEASAALLRALAEALGVPAPACDRMEVSRRRSSTRIPWWRLRARRRCGSRCSGAPTSSPRSTTTRPRRRRSGSSWPARFPTCTSGRATPSIRARTSGTSGSRSCCPSWTGTRARSPRRRRRGPIRGALRRDAGASDRRGGAGAGAPRRQPRATRATAALASRDREDNLRRTQAAVELGAADRAPSSRPVSKSSAPGAR